MSVDDPLVGRELEGFTLGERIGAGATGVVYRATREDSGQVFAVKVLNEALGHIQSLRRRFEREARALGKLTHEHIVHIADFGVVDDIVFIAMEYLEGDTLEDRLQEAPVDAPLALHVMKQILDGVAFAHDLQIVHRDLKPANVFLVERPGEPLPDVKILDFGLAKFLSIDELSQEGTLTRKGRVVGTPAYMAPEQITGVSLDVRADVYAAGIVLFELLADRRPFDYDRRSQLLRAHLFEPLPKLADIRPELEVDPELEAVIRKALAKDPGERYPDARAMYDALQPFGPGAVRMAGDRERDHQRSRAGTTSVVISAEERVKLSTMSDPAAPPTVDAEPPAPLGTLPPEPPPSAAKATAAQEKGRSAAGRGWVTALVWLVGLAGLGGLAGLAWYATTLR
ncbi:MAG TPA: serine/threonine-protein kinase [Polyangiaceae bacterium LLY-WYZ-15_(1-7)]|nr:serine/threonine-protein kinase [Polyangiaceae bacterium LLY-WYZ-15_(1-7)]HJL03841.1 serine/threonine-protein kinase [Polyangiaceae bacterium LLY-WYZ-15_(1-7)]HJL07577.1 serine/threonine-protein kinase [Polyangiaceae bacterium LLY-WYZ-15_(1-7)]HJL31854.1 serine/threonine-protein kinase [Polyangiaceae bacterium LLY-WYZ-15_(1-7)]HJL38384.1 serine/threonine-protein kinase [Polyangiaceae bacterium LLY-WYZ-15_(1-7)]